MMYLNLTTEFIIQQLNRPDIRSLENPYPQSILTGYEKKAAILIPLTTINQTWHLIFIRRTTNDNDRHSGQVAFPGGGMELSDPDLQTVALRETEEEIGVNSSDVQILGRLNDFLSISNYRVTPFVGKIPWPYNFVLDEREVSRVFTIRFSWLADPENHEINYKEVPGHNPFPVIYFKEYDGEVLWGFTARVTLQLLELLKQ